MKQLKIYWNKKWENKMVYKLLNIFGKSCVREFIKKLKFKIFFNYAIKIFLFAAIYSKWLTRINKIRNESEMYINFLLIWF